MMMLTAALIVDDDDDDDGKDADVDDDGQPASRLRCSVLWCSCELELPSVFVFATTFARERAS